MNAFIRHMFQHSNIYQDDYNNICCGRTHVILVQAGADLDSPQTAVLLAEGIIAISQRLDVSSPTRLQAEAKALAVAQPEPNLPATPLALPLLDSDEEKTQEVQIVFVPMPSASAPSQSAAPGRPLEPDPSLQVYFQHIDFTLFQLSQAQSRQRQTPAWLQRIGLFLRFIKLQLIILFELRPVSLYELQQPKKTGTKALYDVRTWSKADDRNLLDTIISFFASKVNLLGQAEVAIWRSLGYSYPTQPLDIPSNAGEPSGPPLGATALLEQSAPFTEPLMPKKRADRNQSYYSQLRQPPNPLAWNVAAQLEAEQRSNQP